MSAAPLQFLLMVFAGWINRRQLEIIIEIETRRVQIAGIVRQPHGTWMKQVVDGLAATRLGGDLSRHPAHRRGGAVVSPGCRERFRETWVPAVKSSVGRLFAARCFWEMTACDCSQLDLHRSISRT